MIRRRASRAGDERPLRSRAILGCAALVVAVVTLGAGTALGRLSAGRAAPAAGVGGVPSPAPAASSAPESGATKVVAGVPEGFADTRDGAVDAAKAILGVEAGELMAQPEAYRAAWREMCTPAYYSSTGRAAAEAVLSGQESNNRLLSNAAAGQRIFEVVFPLSVVILTYTDAAVTARTWSLRASHPGDGPTTVSFAAGTLQLRWWAGIWKLDGGSSSTSPADGASGPLLLDSGPQLPAYLTDPPAAPGGSSNG